MDFRAALCQMQPALGLLDDNFAAHHAWLDRAAEAGAQLALFPELSLTGYLRTGAAEMAMATSE